MDTSALAPSALTVAYYQNLLAQHGNRPEAVGWTKGKEWRRYSALLNSWVGHTDTVLDYGCGLGHLGVWMHRVQGRQASYRGVDVVPEFIAANQETFANQPVKKDGYLNITAECFGHIESAADVTRTYDHIVLCGVFNFIANPNEQHFHAKHIAATLAHLFDHCKIGLHVDFLSPDVDTREPQLHYQSIHDLVNLLKPLSRRYEIDRTYLPYEYCVHIKRDQRVDAKDNTFAG